MSTSHNAGVAVRSGREVASDGSQPMWIAKLDSYRVVHVWALGIVAECAALGRAEGAHVDDSIVQEVVYGYRAQPPDSINSMLADCVALRPMEIDARNGVVVRKGESHRIKPPLNRMAVALLRTLGETSRSQ
jgi:ketopantoate reductase